MKLLELITYLLDPKRLDELYREYHLNIDSEALLIYMEGSLDLESDIKFFEIEETEDALIFEKNGVQYVQLFALHYATELIESDLNLKNKGYSDLEISERLLAYRQNDA